MDTLPFNTVQVLDILGYSLRPQDRHQTYIDCPFCRGKKKLNFNLDRGVFRCNMCEISGNSITFYANVMGENNKEAYHDICERLNINSTVDESEKKLKTKKKEEKPVEESTLASIDVLNKTYTQLEYELTLSQKHNKDLKDRGFTQEFIIDKGYKTFPAKEAQDSIVTRLLQQGCDLKGVAGFYRDKYTNKWCMTNSKNGIFVKYVDFNNRVQGMQIRIDNELLDEGENKYKWFSSRYMNEGCGIGSLVHYACDFAWDRNNRIYKPLSRNDTFVLTEGALKANLFFHLTGQPAIAIAGVNCTKNLQIELAKLVKIGVKKIIIAYDMDFVMNIHVMKALEKIKRIIMESGLTFTILLWDKKMINKDGSEMSVQIVEDNNFNLFVFTPKTYQKAVDEEILPAILQTLKELGVQNLAFAFSEKNVSDNDSGLYKQFIKETQEFHAFPVLWKLKYKGIDDYYYHKIRETE